MSYESEFTPTFLKLMKKLDSQTKERVLKEIGRALKDPRSGSRLVFARQVCFKWRVGGYRMIYTIDEKRNVLTFIVVDHRSKVYRRYRL